MTGDYSGRTNTFRISGEITNTLKRVASYFDLTIDHSTFPYFFGNNLSIKRSANLTSKTVGLLLLHEDTVERKARYRSAVSLSFIIGIGAIVLSIGCVIASGKGPVTWRFAHAPGNRSFRLRLASVREKSWRIGKDGRGGGGQRTTDILYWMGESFHDECIRKIGVHDVVSRSCGETRVH